MSNMETDDDAHHPGGSKKRPIVIDSDRESTGDETTDDEATQLMEFEVAQEDGGEADGEEEEDRSGPTLFPSLSRSPLRDSPSFEFEQYAQGSAEDEVEPPEERSVQGSPRILDSQATEVMSGSWARDGEGSTSSRSEDSEYFPPSAAVDQSSEERMSAEEELARRFIALVRKWLAANDARAVAAANSGSGWENWLQVELYCYVVASSRITIEREPHSYPGDNARLRGDLVLNGSVTVELKAKTKRESSRAYAVRVLDDTAKVEKLEDAAAIVLGLSLAGDADADVGKATEERIRASSFTVAFTFSQGAKAGVQGEEH